jgi:hypothetical protein
MAKIAPTHDELRNRSKLAAELIPEHIWEGIHDVNRRSSVELSEMWQDNVRDNLKAGCLKGQMRANELTRFGTNKAVLAVGAGPSLNKNIDVVKEMSDICIASPNIDVQPFVIVASNHMYKPLLEKGIHPHFVMLVDGGEAIYEQLCKDVPKKDKTILLAPLQIHPTIARDWVKQGRSVVWFHGMDEKGQDIYREYEDDDPAEMQLEFGGNVINCIWALGVRYFRSQVFMCVGNDLCFPRETDVDDRRKGFYATGDYDVNISNKRDEARSEYAWMGFDLRKSAIVDGSYLELKPVNMSHSQFTYKIWAETQVIMNSESPMSWQYFNCSEGGSLGVMSKGKTREEMARDDNWYLLDEKLPLRYRTRRLEDAAWQFLKAREMVAQRAVEGILTDAKSAGILHPGTNTAPLVGIN